MKFEVQFTLEVEDDTTIFSIGDDKVEVLKDFIINMMRDVDDFDMTDLDVYPQ